MATSIRIPQRPQSALPRIAVGQMTSTNDPEKILLVCTSLAEQAVAAGACMLFLPECFHFLGIATGEGAAIAEPLDGASLKRYALLARSHGLWLSLGGFQERELDAGVPESRKCYNTHVVINADGDITASYRKVHLFDLDLPGLVLRESASTQPGTQLVVAETPLGKLGLSTCYDLRFPEMYSALVRAGASVLAVPAAFTVPTGSAHWEILLRARAIETQSYVVAAAQVGQHNDKRTSYGHALVVDPWGTIIAQCSDACAPGIVTADINLAYVNHVRARMPVQGHMRREVYDSPVSMR